MNEKYFEKFEDEAKMIRPTFKLDEVSSGALVSLCLVDLKRQVESLQEQIDELRNKCTD
jgi:hypothetical protein